jgi:hypothetical protein
MSHRSTASFGNRQEYIAVAELLRRGFDVSTPLAQHIRAAKRANPQADVSAWEREIDERVYRLYGLTAEEIKIVEEGVKRSRGLAGAPASWSAAGLCRFAAAPPPHPKRQRTGAVQKLPPHRRAGLTSSSQRRGRTRRPTFRPGSGRLTSGSIASTA